MNQNVLEVVTHLPWQQSPGKTCWGHHSKVLSIPWCSGTSTRLPPSESRSRRCDSAPDCTSSHSSAYKKHKAWLQMLHVSVGCIEPKMGRLFDLSVFVRMLSFTQTSHLFFLKVCRARYVHHVHRYLLNVAACQRTLKTCGTYR